MVSRRVSGDTSLRFIFAQGENRVAGTTNLESSGFLEILTFEKDFSAAHPIDRGGGQDRGSMDEGFDPLVGLTDIFQRWLCSHRPVRSFLIQEIWQSASRMLILVTKLIHEGRICYGI
jgi:hypothetical protein